MSTPAMLLAFWTVMTVIAQLRFNRRPTDGRGTFLWACMTGWVAAAFMVLLAVIYGGGR